MTAASCARAYATLWAMTLVAAAPAAAIEPLGRALRDAFGFRMHPHRGTLGEAATIAVTNARVLTLVLLCGAAALLAPALRPATDAIVGAVCATNAFIVGLALGAHGGAALRWLPHLPLEWGALAVGCAMYVALRGSRASRRATVYGAGCALALVVCGAAVEVYATPQHSAAPAGRDVRPGSRHPCSPPGDGGETRCMSAKEERTDRDARLPRVACTSCEFAWYSVPMAHGLRTLGSCPRCGGELRFDERPPAAEPDVGATSPMPPHLALGLPRFRPR
jgi:hypothetical protein